MKLFVFSAYFMCNIVFAKGIVKLKKIIAFKRLLTL